MGTHFYAAPHMNTTHTMRPQFEVRGNKIYGTRYNEGVSQHHLPQFEIRGDKVFSTVHNAAGKSLHPWYQIRGSKVYQTHTHPEGHSAMASFHIR